MGGLGSPSQTITERVKSTRAIDLATREVTLGRSGRAMCSPSMPVDAVRNLDKGQGGRHCRRDLLRASIVLVLSAPGTQVPDTIR